METLNTAPSSQMPVWNTALRYGGFCAAAMVVLSLLIYITNFNVMALSGLAVMYISMFGICFATAAIGTKYQRDQLDGGYITYGKAVLVGLLIVLVGMFVSSLWNYILVNFIDPNYVAGMKEQFVAAWGEKMPAESLEEALKGFDKTGDLLTNIKNGIIGGLVIGLIVGLITAAFLKKQPETTKF